MKRFRLLCMIGLVLAGAATMAVLRIGSCAEGSSALSSMKDLPSIVLERCVNVQKLLGRNPFSPVPNDYLLVTRYEEMPKEAGTMKHGLISRKALNIYLVQDLLLLRNLQTGVVHETMLIVNDITVDAESSRETVREWILIDDDGDRNVDRGVFHETLKEKGKAPIISKEMKFPRDRLKELQAYYEKTASTLNSKADSGPTEGCVIS